MSASLLAAMTESVRADASLASGNAGRGGNEPLPDSTAMLGARYGIFGCHPSPCLFRRLLALGEGERHSKIES